MDLNLALDLQRTGAELTSPEETRALRERIRAELNAEFERERETPRGYTIAGLVIGVFGLGQMLTRMAVARGRRGR